MFLVGGPSPVRWPSPTHCSLDMMNQQRMFGPSMKQWVSIGDALGLESIGGDETSVTKGRPDWWHRASSPNGPMRTVGSKGNSHVNINIDAGTTTLGTGVPGSESWRLEKPSPAITSRDWRGARHQKFDPTRGPMTAADATWRAIGRRRLTWKECALIQGFPDDHPFTGKTQVSIYKQVGNAVCPRVSEVLGRCVLSAMETR